MNGIAAATLCVLSFGIFTLCEAQEVSVVRSFTGTGASADPEFVTPVQGPDSKLYGTTLGTSFGSVFRLQTNGKGGDLYAFDGTQGITPYGGLTLGTDGNFYGTTYSGGTANNGVLFRITSSGTYTVLHNFAGGADGGFSISAPIEGSDGNYYGTTIGAPDISTIYRYTPQGTFNTIYQFDQASGSGVVVPVIEGSDGNLYGSATQGGTYNCGTIFKMTKSGVIVWYESFTCGKGGATPNAALVQASDGNFYGTTSAGGDSGLGTIFKLDQQGLITVLYSFRGRSDGQTPDAPLVEGTDGSLYGTTVHGGTSQDGTLFRITKDGVYSLLYSFIMKIGREPAGGLLQHTNGLFYGTTYIGGAAGFGSVYSLNMGLSPFVTFIRPTGKAGQTAQILGQGLTGTTSVTFNGVAATKFSVVSDTYMTAVVPAGATTGAVVVATPAGNLTSNVSFRISK